MDEKMSVLVRQLAEDMKKLLGENLRAMVLGRVLPAQKPPASSSELKNIFPALLDELDPLARWLGELEAFQGQP